MSAVTRPFSCCIILPVQDHKGDLQEVASKSQKRVSRYSKGGTLVATKRGFHVSIAEFTAPTLATANKINTLALAAIQKFKPFDISTYKKDGRATVLSGPKKEYAVVFVKVSKKKSNPKKQVLVNLHQEVEQIVVNNGGRPMFPTFQPHITVGKITPKGRVGGVRFPRVGKLHLPVDPSKAVACKPFQT